MTQLELEKLKQARDAVTNLPWPNVIFDNNGRCPPRPGIKVTLDHPHIAEIYARVIECRDILFLLADHFEGKPAMEIKG